MARRDYDVKASKEVGGTQEDTESIEEKRTPKETKLIEMKTAQNPKMMSKEKSRRSKREQKTKSAAKRTQRTTATQMKAKAKKPSQEVTENQSMKSAKSKNAAKPGLKKPSMEKTEANSKRSARVAKKPSVGYGEEVTPPGLSGKDLKDAEKQMTPTYESSVMQQPGTPVSNKDFVALQDQITHLPHFHGFICREDLGVLLKKPGDWLIRISVLSDEPKKKDVVIGTKEKVVPKEKTVPKEKNQKYFVISVYCRDKVDKTPVPNGKPPATSPSYRHLVIRNMDGRILVEMIKPFKSFAELIAFYTKHGGSYQGTDFQLLFPVPLSSWEFQHEDVDLLDKKLGEGAFGDVRVGRLKMKEGRKTVEVAVKMLKNTEKVVSREQVAELLHEARIMRGLEHPNVLRSYGTAVLKEPLYLMSELCTLGALREYLKEHKSTITLLDKLSFVSGSARGVEYLHSQKLIHRDLAVRNILLTSDKIPKVSDFGLAKLTDRYEMREACKIPVRYLAPETLELFIFTSKTDVFSFGCVIWEIYENGQQPHDGKNAQTIRAQSKRREFLKLSPSAPDELRRLVAERVFVSDPENRCSMAAIVQCAERLDKSTKK